jgi:hypothetical protein
MGVPPARPLEEDTPLQNKNIFPCFQLIPNFYFTNQFFYNKNKMFAKKQTPIFQKLAEYAFF